MVADAGTVHDHLFNDGTVTEVGCWAHCRRYWFKTDPSEPERARKVIALIGALFHLERKWKGFSAQERQKHRAMHSAPLVQEFFAWCDDEVHRVLDDTPIQKAIGSARNQREALQRFLDDGRLPLSNNASELQLRREVIGRKNWLFVGSDDGAEANAVFTSLLASCQLHGLEPWAYLRDVFILVADWPYHRVLELAPAYWKKTVTEPAVLATLNHNPFRRLALGLDPVVDIAATDAVG